jgi:hypothetical protein
VEDTRVPGENHRPAAREFISKYNFYASVGRQLGALSFTHILTSHIWFPLPLFLFFCCDFDLPTNTNFHFYVIGQKLKFAKKKYF